MVETAVQQGPGRRPTRLSDRKFGGREVIRTGAGYFIATQTKLYLPLESVTD